MVQIKAKIQYNKKIQSSYFRLRIKESAIAKQASPGQFLNIRISDNLEVFLRRPLSIHRINGSDIELIYETIGQGTKLLSQRRPGEYLDVIGPLGKGYSILNTQYSILVAGGMGVAPLIFLAERLTKFKNQNSKIKIIVLIGARTKGDILCEKEFKKLGCDVKIATDDGSRGFKGKVTDLLGDLVSSIEYRVSSIYACGPKPMLKEINRVSLKYKIPAQVSLEEYMACGIGACLGCAVKVKRKPPPNGGVPPKAGKAKGKTEFEYKRACKEGPVFNAEEIIW